MTRLHGDVAVGDAVGPVEFALPLYRLVVAAGEVTEGSHRGKVAWCFVIAHSLFCF